MFTQQAANNKQQTASFKESDDRKYALEWVNGFSFIDL